MKSARQISAAVVALAFVAGALASPVQAQDYPNHSITVVVPFPAGGPSDVVARIVSDQMGKVLGQSLVIENVGGAGGTLGSGRVASAAPDGYTLLAGSMGSHVAAPVLTPNIKYDSARDFVPDRPDRAFARRHRRAEGFSGEGSEGIRGVAEIRQRHAEAGPRRHRLVVAHGVPVVHLGDRGEAHARGLSRHRAGDERPGRRPCRFLLRAVGQRHRADQGRRDQGLWRLGGRAAASLPDVPTAKELGIKYDMSIWAGIFAPKGTPPAVVAQLADALDKALDDDSVKARINNLGGSIPGKAERTPRPSTAT